MPPQTDVSHQRSESLLLSFFRLCGKLSRKALCTGTTNFRVSDWTKSEKRYENQKSTTPILGSCDDVPVSLPAECRLAKSANVLASAQAIVWQQSRRGIGDIAVLPALVWQPEVRNPAGAFRKMLLE